VIGRQEAQAVRMGDGVILSFRDVTVPFPATAD
jgi:hypothetical protein